MQWEGEPGEKAMLCWQETYYLTRTKLVTQTQGINSLSYSKFTHKIRCHNNYYKLTTVVVIIVHPLPVDPELLRLAASGFRGT